MRCNAVIVGQRVRRHKWRLGEKDRVDDGVNVAEWWHMLIIYQSVGV